MASNMKMRGRPLMAALAVGGLALAAGFGLVARAHAQQHSDRMGGHPGFGPGAHFARMCDGNGMAARQAGMLAFAEVKLGITDAERPAWTKFAAAIKASSAPVEKACASVVGQPEPKTLPDHLHRIELIESARLEQLRQITPAVEELYGTLTPKQKETADQLVAGMMEHGHGPGMMRHGPMPGGPTPGRPTPDKAPN